MQMLHSKFSVRQLQIFGSYVTTLEEVRPVDNRMPLRTKRSSIKSKQKGKFLHSTDIRVWRSSVMQQLITSWLLFLCANSNGVKYAATKNASTIATESSNSMSQLQPTLKGTHWILSYQETHVTSSVQYNIFLLLCQIIIHSYFIYSL